MWCSYKVQVCNRFQRTEFLAMICQISLFVLHRLIFLSFEPQPPMFIDKNPMSICISLRLSEKHTYILYFMVPAVNFLSKFVPMSTCRDLVDYRGYYMHGSPLTYRCHHGNRCTYGVVLWRVHLHACMTWYDVWGGAPHTQIDYVPCI